MSNAKFGGKFQKLKSLKSAFSDSDCLIQMRERDQFNVASIQMCITNHIKFRLSTYLAIRFHIYDDQ
jgi:hypothetical protein